MNSTVTTCCICLAEYEASETPFALSCGHRVHSECMLRLCLNGESSSARCPYCRASLGSPSADFEDLEDSGDSEESDDDDETEAESGPQLPQWMRLQWAAPTPGRFVNLRLQRIQQGVVKKLLKRANNKGAPDILKRCAEGLKRLQSNLAAARAEAKLSKNARTRRTVADTLRLLKRKEAHIRCLERRTLSYMRQTLLKLQKSQNVVNYFWLHPISDSL